MIRGVLLFVNREYPGYLSSDCIGVAAGTSSCEVGVVVVLAEGSSDVGAKAGWEETSSDEVLAVAAMIRRTAAKEDRAARVAR